MTATVSVGERNPEELRSRDEGPGSGLMENMEALEEGVKNAWKGIAASVGDSVDSAQGMVDKTMREAQEAVEGAAHSLGRALDFRAHARRHPWLLVAGAFLLGLCVARFVARRNC